MSNKKISIITNVVLPITVITITIMLFFMFQPQEATALFWINLCYTVFLEVVSLGYINFLHIKTKDLSAPFFTIFGIYCMYYITLSFGCMLAYPLIATYFTESHKIYIAVLTVLTMLWIIVSVITAQTDSRYRKTIETLKERGLSLNYYIHKIALLASYYDKLCTAKGLKIETKSSYRTELDRLKAKISFLSPNVFNNETAAAQIVALFSNCEELIDEMENATNENAEAVQIKMQLFVDSAIAELDMVKKLAASYVLC